ncbi:MAG TPA: LPS assembly protein LptD [Candidatus Limnocylindrales bacterium]|nr:LPS assembly protein LptD [Candidatus Limnocylindrales bacterium]
MRSQTILVITAGVLCHLVLLAPLLASQTLPAQQPVEAGNPCHIVLTSPPTRPGQESEKAEKEAEQAKKIPISESQPVDVTANQCEKDGNNYTLRGDVEVTFGDYRFSGDTVTYNSETGELTSNGGASLSGGVRDLHITATQGTYNLKERRGKFYDVVGTTGARFRGKNVTLTSSSPIAFTGKVVEQTGPDEFVLHSGSVTSCELPKPKWTFNAGTIVLRVGNYAHVYNTTFRLKGVPVIYLPYVAPPVERLGRQSGFLIPTFGTSNARGTILGDSFFWAVNRSLDTTFGAEYYSKRGWSLQDTIRAKPSDNSFLNVNYFQVLDRGIAGTDANGKPTTVKQGGEDVKLNGEANFSHRIRGVAALDYLSSFVFRLAFTENFSQAVDSEVKSVAFLSKSTHGFSFNAFGSRYQNFQSTNPGDVITILHGPALELSSVDQKILNSPVYWSYDIAGEGVRRSEPGFVTPGLVGRFDIYPDFSLPLLVNGWMIRPEVDLRNTVYTQQQVPGTAQPVPVHNEFNRRTIDTALELRPPALAKEFDGEFLGAKVKHTIEPRVVYRYTNGVESFGNIIRFDSRDILSNTNEVEFGLMQRLFFKKQNADCGGQVKVQTNTAPITPAAPGRTAPKKPAEVTCAPAGADEFLSWEVKGKYFIDPTFGGAVVSGQRNVLTTTVDYAGIAFLTDPRRFAPVVSRLRVRTTRNSDLEWELDYDSKKGRINSSTVYANLHLGNFLVEGSHAYLQVPGEVVFNTPPAGHAPTPLPTCIPGVFNPTNPCVPPVFDQWRALLGYGNPSKRGWSAAANVGVDSEFNLVQYSAAQTAYNWDCCGVSFEYRRFSLGNNIRNENQYRFSFTLANIGSFGNLKRQTRLF